MHILSAFVHRNFFATLLSLLLAGAALSQASVSLPRGTPDAEHVSRQGILNFVSAVEHSKNEMHSFMLLRHGKVVAEGWWDPYAPDLKHTLYSLSKSFTSTAVGLAINEGKLHLQDKVISFFPDDVPDSVGAYLRDLTVRDLLTMSVGQTPDPTTVIPARDTNWIRGFLATPIQNKPGTTFLYNSMATYMLSAIVQKVTGQRVLDYLKPRLFAPLDITGEDWETDPKGINTGGWGLRLKTEDIAKMGQLYLQKGKWKGRQVLPQDWVEEATSMKILQSPDMPQEKRDQSDWQQGYCYQFWRCRNNCYRGDGAFGQYMIVMPEKDAVLAITSETADMQDELNLVWKYILPAMDMPDSGVSAVALHRQLAHLALALPPEAENAAAAKAINGKTFTMDANEAHLRSVSLRFTGGKCALMMKTDTASYAIGFAAKGWERSKTNRPGPNLVARAKNSRNGLAPYPIATHFYWPDASTIELTLRYIDSPHTERIRLHFDGQQLEYRSTPSFNPAAVVVIKGRAE